MSIARVEGSRVPIHLWSPEAEVEPQAMAQLKNIASLPWVFSHVAAMADVHYGIGATVGSVIAMKGALAPSAVGVDIGCGVDALRTSLCAKDLPDSLSALRSAIEAAIPVGFTAHAMPVANELLAPFWREFSGLTEKVQDILPRARLQMGTLGGGNHFIEVCLDETDRVWLMLHSGSRNIGKTLAEIHISKAKKLAHNADLPDSDLAVFLAGTEEMAAYRRDLYWAQRYAAFNRMAMMEIFQGVMAKVVRHFDWVEEIHCHHNYVAEETHFGEHLFVTRKGAISAELGRRGIIPGSMGTRSYIVTGKGNPEAFNSASHGAGRRMSRGQAKRSYTLEDLAAQTMGVECRKDGGVLDEIPGAYKDIDRVMENQGDLVSVDAVLKAVLCVKG